jgi:hypothetical protein
MINEVCGYSPGFVTTCNDTIFAVATDTSNYFMQPGQAVAKILHI